MTSRRFLPFVLTRVVGFALAALLGACQTTGDRPPGRVVQAPHSAMMLYHPSAENSPGAMAKPYLVLVSIDGYRWDYNKKFSPPRLKQLAADGVQAESLRPAYPSKTFPNHYTIVTGMNPEHHGIVSNEFFDPARGAKYAIGDVKSVEDGSWYFGDPLWITAGQQGMLSASFFWVGAEANVEGGHPNYFYRYDDSIPVASRVDQVLAWLNLPPEKRPHFITLYIETVDSAAHRYGVESAQVREAVSAVDQQIGRLQDGLKNLGIPVNLMVVSDHGMQDVDAKKVISLDEKPAAARILAKFQVVGRGPQVLLYLNKGEKPEVIEEAAKILSAGARNYRVWRRDQMTKLNYSATPRVGDLIVEPDLPYLVGMRAHSPVASGANHGWDPVKNKAMHGIFMAQGPAFKEKFKLPTVDNINLYPLMLAILGLNQRVPVDGHLEPVKAALK